MGSDDVNIAYANVINTLDNVYCPVMKVKVKDSCKKNLVVQRLKNGCRKKKNLYRLFLPDRTEISESRYETYKNKLTSTLRSTEMSYYSKLLAEKRTDIKETWAVLNTVIHRQRPSIKYPIHLKCGGKDISTKKDMTNAFNKFFTNIGSNLAKTL